MSTASTALRPADAAYAPRAGLSRALQRVLSLQDFEREARRHLPKVLFEYIAGAAEDNASLRANRDSFQQYAFRPRVLVDVSHRCQQTALFGTTYACPFGIAPVGISAMSAYRGDVVMARAAAAEGIPAIMSGSSLIRMEEVAQAAPDTWFQAYLPGEQRKIDALIERVKYAGFRTLVLTVDIPVWANRENNVRAGFSLPLRPSLRLAWDGITHPHWLAGTLLRTMLLHGMPHFENSFATRGAPMLSATALRDTTGRDHLSWTTLERIRRMWPGALVVKGILHEEDARRAMAAGVDGIIVSNHGGRQLDGAAAPLHVLPGIVDAVGSSVEVMMDGGIRRGSDVLKALALGARSVFVGRPFMYAASIGGGRGVRHAISLLRDEVDRNMAMLGVCNAEDVTADVLARRPVCR